MTGVPNSPQFVKAAWYRRRFSPLLIRRVCICNETGKYTGPRKRTFTVVLGFTRHYWVSSSICKVFISPSPLSLTCRPQDKKSLLRSFPSFLLHPTPHTRLQLRSTLFPNTAFPLAGTQLLSIVCHCRYHACHSHSHSCCCCGYVALETFTSCCLWLLVSRCLPEAFEGMNQLYAAQLTRGSYYCCRSQARWWSRPRCRPHNGCQG